MADRDDDYRDRNDAPEDLRPERESERPRKKRHLGLKLLGIVVVVPALLFGLWTFATLSYTYSNGERAGIIQKFSRKGWLCRTWEGEMVMSAAPGAMPEKFLFTVRDQDVVDRVMQLYREGARVSLTYEQHKGVPTSCFGETEYFVSDAAAVGPGSAPTGVSGYPAGAPPTQYPGATTAPGAYPPGTYPQQPPPPPQVPPPAIPPAPR